MPAGVKVGFGSWADPGIGFSSSAWRKIHLELSHMITGFCPGSWVQIWAEPKLERMLVKR